MKTIDKPLDKPSFPSLSKKSLTCLFCIAIPLLASCEKPEVENTQVQILRPVKTIVAQTAEMARHRQFSGVTKSAQESRLSFNVSGTITSLPVSVGDRLDKGQLIAELDPSTYQLQVQQAEATLLQTQATMRNARSNYDRIKGLYANSNAAKNDLDSARSNSESASAQVRASQKSMELARLNLSYTKLHAETACTVASVEVDKNENVTSGATIVDVACGGEINVEVSVPESVIGLIKNGMAAEIELNALGGNIYPGIVKEVGYVARSGATFPVTLAVDQKGESLRSGMAADVNFDLPVQGKGLLVLPSSVVSEDKDGIFVYITEDNEANAKEATVLRRTVKIGGLTNDGIEIIDGINTGERIVSAGVHVIRDGLIVRRDW